MKEIILIKHLHEPIKKDSINMLKKFGLSTCKKINFITLFSWDIAKILHSCCFEYFRYTWPRPTLMFIYTKNQLHPSILSWDISKILQSCHFECFGYDWSCPRKLTESTCAKVWYLSARKNELHTLFSWDIAKISQTCYYAYFGDAWLWPPKTMVSACINFVYLRAKNQIHSSSLSWNITDFTNLFFLLCWAYLSTSTKNNRVNL